MPTGVAALPASALWRTFGRSHFAAAVAAWLFAAALPMLPALATAQESPLELGPELEVPDPPPETSQRHPRVAWTGSRFLVLWFEVGEDGDRMRAVRMDRDGRFGGDSSGLPIESCTFAIDLACDGEERCAVACWQTEGGGVGAADVFQLAVFENERLVWQARFEGSRPRLTWVDHHLVLVANGDENDRFVWLVDIDPLAPDNEVRLDLLTLPRYVGLTCEPFPDNGGLLVACCEEFQWAQALVIPVSADREVGEVRELERVVGDSPELLLVWSWLAIAEAGDSHVAAWVDADDNLLHN